MALEFPKAWRGVFTNRIDNSKTSFFPFGTFSMSSLLVKSSLSGFVSMALLVLFFAFVALVFHALRHLGSPDR